MNRPRHPIAQDSAHLHLNKIRFTVVPHKWSAVALMLHELGVDEPTVRASLEVGHGIVFNADDDPILWFVYDSEMRQKLYDSNFRDPTDAQLIGTSRCVGLSEADAREKFVANFMGDN